MKFMQRFRGADPVGPQDPKDTETENDPIGIQLKKWQGVSKSAERLIPDHETELRSDMFFAFDADPRKHHEFEFKKGTIIKKHAEKEVVSEVDGESSGSVPEFISIGRRIPEELPDGKVGEVYRTMFIVNPVTQELVDYTDPKYPKGKKITNTNSLAFLGVSALLSKLSRHPNNRIWE